MAQEQNIDKVRIEPLEARVRLLEEALAACSRRIEELGKKTLAQAAQGHALSE
jgi:hypothetical protein